MKKLPNKIENCPIKESVLELRFASEYPVDAIFGILYAQIKDFFDKEVVSLPVLQLPESVRAQDPNLKYQAYHQVSKDNIILKIGPRVLTFVNSSPYEGWGKWSNLFYDVLEKIMETDVINRVERVGLRYINFFNDNIFDKVKCKINLINTEINTESTNLRTEIIDNNYIMVVQIGNSVDFQINNKILKGSIIDIDCLYNPESNIVSFEKYKNIIEEAHNKEKELFFSLLNDSFLGDLNPKYGE